MLKLKNLKFKNIGRFVEEQFINFESLGHLVQVDAENRNTGGSSGSGKTTVFNALEYLFGINDIPLTVLQSRLTKESISVTGTFDYDGKFLEIARSKNDGLVIKLEDRVFEGSSKLAEEELDRILSIPRSILRLLLHKRQKEGGFFLQLTPDKMNKFLVESLGLSDFRGKLDIIDARLKILSSEKIALSTALEVAKSGLTATLGAVDSLGPSPIKEIDDSSISTLRAKAASSGVKLTATQHQHAHEIVELEKTRPVLSIIPFDSTNLRALELSRRALEAELGMIALNEKERQSQVNKKISELKAKTYPLENTVLAGKRAETEIPSIVIEIKKIRNNECPTCLQSWNTENAKAKEQTSLGKLLELKTAVDDAKLATESLVALGAEIAMLTKEVSPLHLPIENIKAEIGVIDSKILLEKDKERAHSSLQEATIKNGMEGFRLAQADLSKKHSLEIDLIRGQSEVDGRALELVLDKKRSYDEAISRYQTLFSSFKKQELTYSSKIKETSEKLESILSENLIAEEAYRAVKSYISCSFDDALNYISESSTRIIRNIPNMANATIQLEGLKENKDGKVKEEVNASISMNGELNVPIKSISGGERSAVDLAIDLSVIELIEVRTGNGIDLFILDEPFEGLDTVCVEQVLEILKNSVVDKRLVIVDHNPIIKEFIQDRILVIREGEFSKITA